jgi:putative acetyltransferase
MNNTITIRPYTETDAPLLAAIYFHTIHNINAKDYTKEQLDVWAPLTSVDASSWLDKWQTLPPLVAVATCEDSDVIVGFAEFEANGHIDCFYCHHDYQGCGVGSALMNAIEEKAKEHGLTKIFAEVSVTAKPFFVAKGFQVMKQQVVTLQRVELVNFMMEKTL